MQHHCPQDITIQSDTLNSTILQSTTLHLQTSKITKEDLRKSEGTKTPHLCIGAILTRPDSLRLFLSSSAKKETVYTYRICTALFMHVATIGSQTTTATMTWHSGHKVPTKNMKN